jgi:leader peptidase (prepilin peptidase)/N-methyltransferase
MVPLWCWAIVVFVAGCCIGSFLNVVVWRLPRNQSLSKPARSYCPRCGKTIAWYDNIPVLAWLALGGKCRNCRQPISIRYPLVELATGLLFLGLLLAVYAGPLRVDIGRWPGNWPGYLAAVALLAALLAVSLIDLDYFFIPIEIVWPAGLLGVALAAVFPGQPDKANWLLLASPTEAALGVGGTLGLLLSISLLWLGVLPASFPDADKHKSAEPPPPPAPVGKGKSHKSRKGSASAGPRPQPPSVGVTVGARREVLKELLFLMPVVAVALGWLWLTGSGGPFRDAWAYWCKWPHLAGLGGALFGLLIGGGIVWLVRIVGTLAAGREAMGLGDVHLLAAAGAVLGWAGALLAFFMAPFFAVAIGIVQFLRHGRRELPFGPYLSLAVLAVLMFYDRLFAWLAPSLQLIFMGQQ